MPEQAASQLSNLDTKKHFGVGDVTVPSTCIIPGIDALCDIVVLPKRRGGLLSTHQVLIGFMS